MKETYIEINLRKLRKNIDLIKKEIQEQPTMIMAVVKGNAYGHGMVEISKSIENEIDYFGVGFLEEGIKLRVEGRKKPILLLSPIFDKRILDYNIIPTIDSVDGLIKLYKMAVINKVTIDFHLKIDTGMNRFGLKKDDVEEFFNHYTKQDKVKIVGVYSHFANTMENRAKVLYQWERFTDIIKFINSKGIKNYIIHASNSEIALDFPYARLDMIRIGNALYGKCNSLKDIGLYKIGKVKTPVVKVKNVKKGEYIGYGFSHYARKDMKIGIIPIGIEHGFGLKRTAYSFKYIFWDLLRMIYRYIYPKEIYYGEIPLKVVGKVGMQFSIVDISKYPNIKEGSVLEINIPMLFLNESIKRIYCEGDD